MLSRSTLTITLALTLLGIPALTYAVTCGDAGTPQTTNIALCKTGASDFATDFVADYHGNLDAIDTESTGVRSVATGGTGTSTQFTQGSVVFAGASGVYTQDNGGIFFDATNNFLGLNTTTPGAVVDVFSATPGNVVGRFRAATGQTSAIFQVQKDGGANVFRVNNEWIQQWRFWRDIWRGTLC